MNSPASGSRISFVSWDEVLREFARRNRGCDALLNAASAWLNLAGEAERRGRTGDAETYLHAGIIREAYDTDIYEVPESVRALFHVRQIEGGL
jgi:hypothetical protein